jgi:hypothetical protein
MSGRPASSKGTGALGPLTQLVSLFSATGRVLAGSEAEPRGKAPATGDDPRVDDRRHHRRGDHRADAGDCGQPPDGGGAAGLMLQASVEVGDPHLDHPQMLDLKDQELARDRRQARVVKVRDDRQQLLHAEPTTCRDEPELGHVPANCTDRAGSFCDQPIPDPMQHQQGLLGLALDRNNRMLGRRTASQHASASAESCLLVFTYGFTYCGGMSRTSWPSLVNAPAQWCAPPHASIPIRQAGGWRRIRAPCRLSFFLSAVLPHAATP